MQDLVRTHIEGFDAAIGGGLLRGHIILLRGAAGTMKSTVAYYIAHRNALNGLRALYVTLEQSPLGILEQMSELGLDVNSSSDNLHILDFSRGREVLETLAAGGLHFAPEKGNQSEALRLEGLLRGHIENAQKKGNYNILALDSWDALEALLDFEDRRGDTFRFFEWLRGLGLTCLLISEVAPTDDRHETQVAEFLADAIVNLRLDLVGPNEFQRRIQCAKMRGMSHSSDYFTLVYETDHFEIVKAISGGDS